MSGTEGGMYDIGPARLDAPQTRPPCPDWCTDRDGAGLPGHWHTTRIFNAPAYVRIVQHKGEAAVIRLSAWDADAPVIDATAAEARMLAELAKRDVAVALREAADELDQITGAGS